MKIRSVRSNNRKKVFEIRVGTRSLVFPYAKADPQPTPDDPVSRVFVDKELGQEGFTYFLDSGRTGTRLGTSATQLYRLLDQTNYRKSVDQVLSLLQVLDCDVDLVVRAKTA